MSRVSRVSHVTCVTCVTCPTCHVSRVTLGQTVLAGPLRLFRVAVVAVLRAEADSNNTLDQSEASIIRPITAHLVSSAILRPELCRLALICWARMRLFWSIARPAHRNMSQTVLCTSNISTVQRLQRSPVCDQLGSVHRSPGMLTLLILSWMFSCR